MKSGRIPGFALLTTMIICFASCEKERDPTGKYEAVSSNRGSVVLELKEDGSGVWMFNDDEAFFKWEVKDGSVWLHTKEGGVIAGRFEGDSIRILLPGIGEFVFKPAE